MLTARAMGATQICITDISEDRLAFAKKLGATHTVHVNSRDAQEMANRVQQALGAMPDISIECSGAEPSMHTAIYSTKSGGCIVLVGLGKPICSVPIVNACVREVDIRGIFRYANCYPAALAMIASGAVDVKPLVTHRFSLEQTLDAFRTAHAGEGVKVMIACHK